MWLLARRSVVGTFRDPGNLGPALVVPLLLYAVIAGGLGDATKLKGFPTDSMVTFALAIPFVQGAMMSIATTGQGIATDIEHGFIYRLAMTPLRRIALVFAQLAGALALGIVQATVFLAVGFAAGAHIEAGVLGGVVLVVLFLVSVVGFGALGMLIGIWTGSPAAVAGIAPLSAVFLFLSSMAFPRNLIEKHWFEVIATVNPLSYLVEGIRSLLIFGWDKQALALGFAVAGTIAVVGIVTCAWTIKNRIAGR